MRASDLSHLQGGFLKSRGRLLLLFVSTLLGTGLLFAYLLGASHREAERQAATEAQNLLGVLEARLNGTLSRVHADLEQLAALLPRAALSIERAAQYRAAVTGELALYSARFPEIVGYRVADAEGNLLYVSEGNVPYGRIDDRDYFRALVEHPEAGLAISEVMTGRLSGRSIFVIAVPIRERGRLLGVVQAPIDIGKLQQMFDTVDLGPQGVITLRRSDNGRLIVRRPALPDAVNQVLHDNPMHRRIENGERAGQIRFHAALDGVERIYAFQRVGDYPLYVAVGLAVDDFLANWQRTATTAAVSSLLLVLFLSLVLIRVLRAEREEAAMAQRLRESEARYRLLAENSHDVIWTLDIPSRRFTYVSPSVSSLLGYTPEEVCALSLEQLLTGDSLAKVSRDIAERVRRIDAGEPGAQVVTTELEQLSKTGGVVVTEVVSSYLPGADGAARTILGVTRDIGERRRAELAMRASNRQLQERLEEIGQLQSALRELAIRDPLTGLYNRRYLDETLEREVSRARRESIPLSLVMLDIDHFKRVNDQFGHQVGDEVLKTLAGVLQRDTRAEDVACRYGGEEFLILLPGMPLEAAEARAEGWRQTVEALRVGHGERAVRFTISLGVAAYPGHGVTPDDLTRSADLALYSAKHGGRNRVAVVSR